MNEIVFYGIAPGEQLGPGGEHLEPADYHEKLGQDNTVVIDVRNNYEAEIGRFQKVSGSKLWISGGVGQWRKGLEVATLAAQRCAMTCMPVIFLSWIFCRLIVCTLDAII